MPKLRNGSNGDSNPGSLACESGILPLSYRVPQIKDHFINSNLLLPVSLSMLFSSLIVHGFTPSSTTKCTFALTETVNYFRKNKSNVYVMLLDATKAFDKVNYVKLFYQLIDRGLNLFIIRIHVYKLVDVFHTTWRKAMIDSNDIVTGSSTVF